MKGNQQSCYRRLIFAGALKTLVGSETPGKGFANRRLGATHFGKISLKINSKFKVLNST